MPPMAKGGLPPPLVNAILDQKLESEDVILNFLWDRYEEATLHRQHSESVRIAALAENGPQPILIARESIPREYWNGLPQQLELRLQGETDPQQIVADIMVYHAEQEAQKPNQHQIAGLSPASSTGQPPASQGMRDYLDNQRQMREKIEADTYDLLHPIVPPSLSRIRVIPASAIRDNPVSPVPNFPAISPLQLQPNQPINEKGTP
jgi:hypothetical protein